MATSVKVIIFDLDGTLLLRDDKNWETNQLVLWLKFNGVKNPEELLKSEKWKDRTQRLGLLGIDMEEYKNWYENFQIVEYNNNVKLLNEGHISLAQEAADLLEMITIPKVLVSNSCKEWVNYSIDFFNIRKYFRYIFERDYKFGKPIKPNIAVKWIFEKNFGELSSESLVVGDSQKDMEFARNIGFRFISVYNKKIESDYYFKDIRALKDNIAIFI